MATKSTKPVLIWLIIGCIMITLMVAIGGITRLTHSGLSMVEWDLFMGAVPPMNEQEWQDTFDKYQAYPEYKILNPDMDLEGFKSIFFWEYLHRQWGRLMGLVFIIPFLIFLFQRRITGLLMRRCIAILIGGATVGGLGWFMVVSGLKDRPDISHYRLAIHLIAAFTLFGLVLWTALDLKRGALEAAKKKVPKGMFWLLGLVYVQIVFGAFVAGLDAGTIYNTWPLMDGSYIPENTFALSPFWKNILEHRDGVQFVHRNLAILVLVLCLWPAVQYWNARGLEQASRMLALVVVLQFVLGVATLLMQVPVALGVAHQLCALFLLAALFNWIHSSRLVLST